ncbi:MAG: 3-keto-disaccharide hydrolase [Limisphaerales bacterium]
MKNRFTLRLILGLFLVTGVATQAADAKFKPLFNGKNLKGWEPTPGGKWEVKNGVIVGTSPKSERRHGILLTKKRFKDFVVKAKFRVLHGDSGFYFRVDRVKSGVSVHGFQVEIDETDETGGLYETGGRGWIHQPTAEVARKRAYKKGEWSDLELTAKGGDITVKINGVVSTKLTNDKSRKEGNIGLQLHGSQVMHVEYKDIQLKPL